MVRRGPKVKQIVKLLADGYGENPFPWKEPNNRMKKVISRAYQDKLESGVADVQDNIMLDYLNRMFRRATTR